jgi:hypothetical protein
MVKWFVAKESSIPCAIAALSTDEPQWYTS